jgi:hypothetical protein
MVTCIASYMIVELIEEVQKHRIGHDDFSQDFGVGILLLGSQDLGSNI